MKTFQLLLFFLWMPIALEAQAQSHPSKLTVIMGETLEISSDSLHIDTLIMQDNSRIVFLAHETKLVIENAFIGKNCTWDASGRTGPNMKKSLQRPERGASAHQYPSRSSKYQGTRDGLDGQRGGDGNPGRSIFATVLFRFLGELKIDAQGGYGHMGYPGYNGGPGANGSNITPMGGTGGDGGIGGNGGDGGRISLAYACDGFPPLFNEGGFRSIYLNYGGGQGGIGGRPGKGGPGGMPTRRDDYSYSGAVVGQPGQKNPYGQAEQNSVGDGPRVSQPTNSSGNSFSSGVIVEWEGQKGLPGSMGLMGKAGADGKEGTVVLIKLK